MKLPSIRQGLPSDIETIVQMQLAMAKETENLQLDESTLNLGVRAVFDDPSKGTYWIAEIDGETSGMLLTLPEWSDWRNGTVLWIHSVYVFPTLRGQAVFKTLYTQLKNRVASSPELRGLRLYVEQNNINAQKVYEAVGMTREHYFLYEWLK